MNSSRQMTYTQPLTYILGPKHNWQWNYRCPVLGKSVIFSFKNPLTLKEGASGMDIETIYIKTNLEAH